MLRGWPRPAFLIGFVLADQSETYLYQAVQFYDWDFLYRTGVLIILAITIVSAWMGARNVPTGESDAAEVAHSRVQNMRPQAWFVTLVFAFLAWALVDGLTQSFLGGIYTIGIAALSLPFAARLMYLTWSNNTAHAVNFDLEVEGDHLQSGDTPPLLHYLMWLAAFLAAIMLIGFWLAIVGFFVIFLRVKTDASWLRITIMTACGVGFISALAWIMVLDFPGGLLQEALVLPWPIG
ncbi:MAG: hypothetical protein VW338_18305 [Rhodospirillaceae bacterium]